MGQCNMLCSHSRDCLATRVMRLKSSCFVLMVKKRHKPRGTLCVCVFMCSSACVTLINYSSHVISRKKCSALNNAPVHKDVYIWKILVANAKYINIIKYPLRRGTQKIHFSLATVHNKLSRRFKKVTHMWKMAPFLHRVWIVLCGLSPVDLECTRIWEFKVTSIPTLGWVFNDYMCTAKFNRTIL